MHENEIAQIIVDAALKVHKTLGPGLWRVFMNVSSPMSCKKEGWRSMSRWLFQ
jgi:hypothetical protein